MSSTTVEPRAAGEAAHTAPQLPSLPLTAPVDWDALRRPFKSGWSYNYASHSPFSYAWHVACNLGSAIGADGGKVEGWPTPLERDTIAIERGHAWFAKVERGETSCAWHEISEAYGQVDRCPCAKCVRTRREARFAGAKGGVS